MMQIKKNIKDMLEMLNKQNYDLDTLEAILETVEYLDVNFRICSECGKVFDAGYCAFDGQDYYCSDECLMITFNWYEWEDLCSDEGSGCYYTEWN